MADLIKIVRGEKFFIVKIVAGFWIIEGLTFYNNIHYLFILYALLAFYKLKVAMFLAKLQCSLRKEILLAVYSWTSKDIIKLTRIYATRKRSIFS